MAITFSYSVPVTSGTQLWSITATPNNVVKKLFNKAVCFWKSTILGCCYTVCNPMNNVKAN